MSLRNEKDQPFLSEKGSISYPEVDVAVVAEVATGQVVSPSLQNPHSNQPYQYQVNNNYSPPNYQPSFQHVPPPPPRPINNQINYQQNSDQIYEPNHAYQNQRPIQNNTAYQNQRPIPNNAVNYQNQRPNQNLQGQIFVNVPVQPIGAVDRIFIIQESSRNACTRCGFVGQKMIRQSPGCVTFSWCCCLFIFTGIFGFWIPFCVNSCKDVEVICPSCLSIEAILPASCC